MHPHVTHHRIFMGAGRDKNQNRIAIPRFLHAQLKKFFLRPGQGVLLEFSPLNKDADLTRTSPLRLFDRLGNPVVIESAKEIMRSHFYQLYPAPPPPPIPPPELKLPNPPPEDPPPDQLSPPQPPEMKGPPRPV